MYRRLIPTFALSLCLLPKISMAQDLVPTGDSPPTEEKAPEIEDNSKDAATKITSEQPKSEEARESEEAPTGEEESEIEEQPDAVDNQEIGVAMGIALGGGVSPGGLALEGRYLYRLSSLDWIESSVNFSFGSGDAQCFRDRSGSFVCAHGPASGILGQGNVGIRRYFSGQKQFRPFARAGVGLGLVSLSDDDVRGLAIPLYIGAGVRAEVANRVLVVASATLRSGPSILNKDLGLQFHFTGTISAGVEFTLE